MKIKTYVVDDVEMAYPLIYNDLGQDAFILKTKPVKKGGFLGLFQKRQFEVVAAADDISDREKAVNFSELQGLGTIEGNVNNYSERSESEPMVEKVVEFSKLQVQRPVEEKLESSSKLAEQEPQEVKVTAVEQTVATPKKRGRPKKVQEPNQADQPIEPPKKRGRPKKTPVEPIEENPTHQEVLKELSEVKGLIQAMAQTEQEDKLYPKLLEKWVQQLRDHEVDDEVIKYIMKRTGMKIPNLALVSSQVIEQAIFTIIEQLFQEGIDKDAAPTQPFVTLVGPTGVGKTTTIAKLAAAQVIGQRQKVGLLTTDTFRIAAVEQLRTYANILNIPCKVVGGPEELGPAMKALKGFDTVFMDSAGRNYLDGGYVDELNQYLRLDVPQENYLVLSMTTRWRDVKQIVEQMKAVPIDKLILTKWDETTCYGLALNMVYHYPYPLSYLCLGQGVPQDIMKADPIFMAKKLLGVG
jgi:flagellar biosynthesis protein FlhF